MTKPNMTIRDLIRRHEGVKRKPYTDTVGKVTIGVGRNLTDCGLTDDEIEHLYRNDVMAAKDACRRLVPNWSFLDDVRKAALTDMAFNLGYNRLSEFVHMLAAIARKDWDAAAAEMLASKWARQVPMRAAELAEMMRTGEWPTTQ